jgi:hypothetical protein
MLETKLKFYLPMFPLNIDAELLLIVVGLNISGVTQGPAF